ncbi:BQ2448_2186 [Microbotryum intermedium]|uniref:BQ2448_2186 protein n=1 Tax=Microbotryum intermedium TaxID=269621 RepID=A0A238FDJ8_9BASI|nr:BQ2448_2186 [Microbotryum intermedium]
MVVDQFHPSQDHNDYSCLSRFHLSRKKNNHRDWALEVERVLRCARAWDLITLGVDGMVDRFLIDDNFKESPSSTADTSIDPCA